MLHSWLEPVTLLVSRGRQQIATSKKLMGSGNAVSLGNDSFHVIFSGLDALKGGQQPVPLGSRIAQPLLRSLHAHTF